MKEKILIIRFGFFGDTLVALPAFKILRDQFPSAQICLLSHKYFGKKLVLPEHVLRNQNLIDRYYQFTFFPPRWRWMQWIYNFILLSYLKIFFNWKYIIILEANQIGLSQVHLNNLIKKAKWLSPENLITPKAIAPVLRSPDGKLANLPHEAQKAVDVLQDLNMPMTLPAAVEKEDLHLLQSDPQLQQRADEIIQKIRLQINQDHECIHDNHFLIGLTPGSKMTAKLWPKERYLQVLRQLYSEYRAIPLIFGSSEEASLGQYFVENLSQCFSLIGHDIRMSAHLLRRCDFYLGNDTGTMHLAAAVGIPCVAIFSARSAPGNWYPLGKGHIVLRHWVECEGCQLEECLKEDLKCLKGITVEQVLESCRKILPPPRDLPRNLKSPKNRNPIS